MKGFIAKTASGLCLSLGLSALGGCNCYRDLVDPCWPQRYNSFAAQNVRDTHFGQEAKGHQLEQTVWNWFWEIDPKTGQGSDRLSGAGVERLRTITRTQPMPDFQLWLQNAQDVPYTDGVTPEKLVAQRESLNTKRVQAVQRFLATQMNVPAGNFHIAIHDFGPTGIPANVIVGTAPQLQGVFGGYQKLENNFQGVLIQPSIGGGSGGAAAGGGATQGAGAGAGAGGGAAPGGAPGGR